MFILTIQTHKDLVKINLSKKNIHTAIESYNGVCISLITNPLSRYKLHTLTYAIKLTKVKTCYSQQFYFEGNKYQYIYICIVCIYVYI